MQELLSSIDIVNQSFKKTFHGYDCNEVDEFLDKVADTLQRLTQVNKDLEAECADLDKRISEYESMRSTLQNAILLAQKSAEDRVNSAREQANGIIREAQAKAEEITEEATEENTKLRAEVAKIRGIRDQYLSEFRSLLAKYDSQLGLIMSSRYTAEVNALCDEEAAPEPVEEEAPEANQNAKELEAACGMLGIDPKFFNGKK